MRIGYARVSTDSQSLDKQLDQLEAEGIDARNVYKDKMSGTDNNRPELKRMIEELLPGDEIVVCDITRISRSTKDLLSIIAEIKDKGASLRSIKDSWLDTSVENPYSSFLLTVMAGLSQLERDLISVRTKESLRSRRLRGVCGGRPKGRKHAKTILSLHSIGLSVSEIAESISVSTRTVHRVIKENETESKN